MYLREDKIFKKGIKGLWKHSRFPSSLEYPCIKSIKEQLSQQFQYGNNELDSYVEIYPKAYYKQLFENKNEELIDIIVAMTKFIMKCKGQTLTNSFQIENLFKVGEKEFYLKDLGRSAISQSIKLRDRTINHLYPPILREDSGDCKWLLRPQYMSP